MTRRAAHPPCSCRQEGVCEATNARALSWGNIREGRSYRLSTFFLQKVAKHAEPAANELSDRMEDGADKFSKNAGPAAKELSDKAVKVAHDVKEQAGPRAHQVCFTARFSWLRFNKGYTEQRRQD